MATINSEAREWAAKAVLHGIGEGFLLVEILEWVRQEYPEAVEYARGKYYRS